MADETRTGKGVRIALIVSLALNLLVVGVIGGAMLSGDRWQHRGPPRMQAMGGPLTRALAPDDRRALAREMRAAHHDRAWSRQRLREDFTGLVADLQATPFDPQAVEARLARIQDGVDERIGKGQAMLVARLARMDDAERAAYAERLQVELQRRHRDGGDVRPRDGSEK